MIPVRQQGLLAEIPLNVLWVGSLWVLMADGIFAGMALYARNFGAWQSIALALLIWAALCVAVFSRIASSAISLVAALVFGGLIYRISAIATLAVVVLLQIGLMHFVACAILRSRWQNNTAAPSS